MSQILSAVATQIPVRHVADSVRYRSQSTQELRDSFLFTGLFTPGAVQLHFVDYDRLVLGGAVPTACALEMPVDSSLLAAEFFTQRRELGVFNVGGAGLIRVDGTEYPLGNRECLYIGQGHPDILFESAAAENAARFFLASYPAHTSFPIRKITPGEYEPLRWGDERNCNKRVLHQLLNPNTAQTCQLTMGCTELEPGCNWNTFPCHLHSRRCEAYLYFDMASDARVFHFLGAPEETRHIVIANEEAVYSPFWSIHSGVGTRRYSFVWAMGGENRDILNVDPVPIEEIR